MRTASLIATAAALLAASPALAQTYHVRGGAQPFAPISSGTPLVFQPVAPGGDALEDGTMTLALPFSFSFHGTPRTSVALNTNGLLLFGTECAAGSGDDTCENNFEFFPSSEVPNDYIGFWWDDMVVHPAGVNLYAVSGTAPNRVLTIQLTRWYRSTYDDERSIQVQLFETSNRIRINFGPMIGANNFGATTIGVQNAAGTGVAGMSCEDACYGSDDWKPNSFLEFVPATTPGTLKVRDTTTSTIDRPELFLNTFTALGSTRTQSVTLENTGTAALNISGITLTSGDAADFSLSGLPPFPYVLAAGAKVTYQLVFAPTTANAGIHRVTSMAIASDDVLATREVLIAARAGIPDSEVSPTSLAFGKLRVGSPLSRTVTWDNTGGTSLTLQSATLSGTHAQDFTLQPGTLPATLSSGATRTITVRFTPGATGVRSALLTIVDSHKSHQIAITGEGVVPVVRASPAAIDFGTVRTGEPSVARPITIANSGTDTMRIDAIRAMGAGGNQFVASLPALPRLVPAGESVTFSAWFQPATSGTFTATVEIATDDPSTPVATVALSGTGSAPLIATAPASLSFADQRVGQASTPRTLTLQNTSNDALHVTSLALQGAGAGDFSFTPPTLPATIAGNGTLALPIAFQPAATGSRAATLVIGSDAVNAPSLPVSLSGNGTAPAASVLPAGLGFGQVRVGQSSSAQTVTVSNGGTASLSLTAFDLIGGDASHFQATGPVIPASVSPGGTVQVSVTARPTTSGAKSALLQLVTDGGSFTVPLTAAGIAPVAIASPAALDFGGLPLNTTSGAQTLTVLNTGSAPLTVSAASLAGANRTDFALTAPGLPATLAAGDGLAFTVRATPSAAGPRSAVLDVVTDDRGLSIPLSSEGLTASFSIDPSSADFGALRVEQSGTPVRFNLRNGGSTSLAVRSLTIAGANASDFAASGFTLPLIVPAGGSRPVDVRFRPTAIGLRTAALQATSDDPAQPSVSVALSGNGTSPKLTASPASASFGEVRTGTVSSEQTVTLGNPGTAPLALTSIAVTGSQAARFTVAGAPTTFPSTIPAGGSVALKVTFAPVNVGLVSARLAIGSDAPGAALLEVPLDGEGTAPGIQVRPVLLDFGSAQVGTAAPARKVTVTNTGKAELALKKVSVSGDPSDSFALSTTPVPPTVAPGASVELEVTFQPTVQGARSGLLELETDAEAATVQVALLGTGVAAVANLSPAALDFGMLKLGATLEREVTLRNIGTSALKIDAPAITGAGAAQFKVALEGSTTLEPGREAIFRVTFAPSSAGSFEAQLTASSPDGSVDAIAVPLKGAGAAASIALSPSAIEFGSLAVGSATEPQTVTVTNSGELPLQLRSVTSDSPEFTFDAGNLPASLAPGESGTIAVFFKPLHGGARSGVLRVAADGADFDASVALTGTGQEPVVEEQGCGCGSTGAPAGLLALVPLLGLLRRRVRLA